MYVNASHVSSLELWSQDSITWVIRGHLARKFQSACASAQGAPKVHSFNGDEIQNRPYPMRRSLMAVCVALRSLVGWRNTARIQGI